jgi:hypothetical protein
MTGISSESRSGCWISFRTAVSVLINLIRAFQHKKPLFFINKGFTIYAMFKMSLFIFNRKIKK